MNQWVNNVFVPVLREIANFENYQIFVGGPLSTITIQGLSAFDHSPSASGTGFTFTSSNTPGNIGVFREDYFIRLRIAMNVEQQGLIYPVRSRWHFFKPLLDDDNKAYIEQDIGRLIEELMQDNDLYSTSDSTTASVSKDARKVYVSIQEYYDASPGLSPYVNTNIFRVIRGGREAFARSISVYQESRFLTNRRHSFTDGRLPDWTYFIEPEVLATNTLRYIVDVIDEEGAMSSHNIATIPKIEAGRVVKIPVGWTQLGLSEIVPNAKKYFIRVVELNAQGSAVGNRYSGLSFTLLPESDYVSGLHYYNSFGLLEGILLNGSIEAIVEWMRSFENMDLPLVPTATDHQELSYEIEKQMTFNCTTGPISKTSWSAAMDMVLSQKHYWLDVINKRVRYAVRLAKGKSQIGAYNPDGVGTGQLPITIHFAPSKVNTTSINILDI